MSDGSSVPSPCLRAERFLLGAWFWRGLREKTDTDGRGSHNHWGVLTEKCNRPKVCSRVYCSTPTTGSVVTIEQRESRRHTGRTKFLPKKMQNKAKKVLAVSHCQNRRQDTNQRRRRPSVQSNNARQRQIHPWGGESGGPRTLPSQRRCTSGCPWPSSYLQEGRGRRGTR